MGEIIYFNSVPRSPLWGLVALKMLHSVSDRHRDAVCVCIRTLLRSGALGREGRGHRQLQGGALRIGVLGKFVPWS